MRAGARARIIVESVKAVSRRRKVLEEMRPLDTSLGGPERRFPDTTVGFASLLTGAPDARAFETLCRRYWKPIYAYVRAAWAKSNEDAKDLTQAFLVWLMEGEALGRFDPSIGSFRRYLRVLLARFVGHRETSLQRLKRGGGLNTLSLDADEAALAKLVAHPHAGDPEAAFDHAWINEVFAQAVGRVRERRRAAGQELPYKAYEAFALGPGPEPPSYEEVAAGLGVKVGEVRNFVHRIREEIRTEVRAELAEQTSGHGELEDEWRSLLGA